MSTVSRRSVIGALATAPVLVALASSPALAAAAPSDGAGASHAAPKAAAAAQTLSLGSHGAAVKSLQDSLNRLGYWCGSADGTFGELTQQAVFAVQKVNGLSRDGVVGPKTAAAIKSGKRPSASSTAEGIEVHLASQVVLVVHGGKVTTILNTSTAGGQTFYYHGRAMRAVTPKGNFHVYQSGPAGWQTGALGPMWRPY